VVQSATMSDRPTLKLKPGAAARNPQRLRVRATTAPRKAATAAAQAPAAAPKPKPAPRPHPSAGPHAPPKPRRDPSTADPRSAPPRPRPPPLQRPLPTPEPAPAARTERRVLSAAAPATPAAQQAAQRPRPMNSKPDEGIRLSKALTEQGIASRREADDWIAAGWVRVDGQMAVLGQRVRPEQRIDIDPAARKEQARSVTILLNKPVGHVSGQAEDGYPPAAALITPANLWAEEKRPFHPGHARGLAPAGRLDIDSTGLLVLTQDGRIAKLLIGENSLVEKEYLVRVAHAYEGGVPDSVMQLLRHGLELDGEALKPAKVSWANEDQLRVVLQQGKKRQIRRMCEAVGLQVLGLKRVRIGSVVLGKLPAGQWRYLRDDERF
jgi:23S rRNA pseudouridine2604 synthase